MAQLKLRELPACDADRLAAAVRKVVERQALESAAASVGPRSLQGRLPPTALLASGAAKLESADPEDAEAVRHFHALLEAGYLVAAADGLDDRERAALSGLIAEVTGSSLTGERLGALFAGFEQRRTAQGLESRLAQVAGAFEDFVAREEALGFAALVAIGDCTLSQKEAVALQAFGARLGFSVGEVQAVLDSVASALAGAIDGS
jgi:tellurite resistance protein